MGETIIKIENMYHTYKGHVDSDGEVAALTDINLTVTEGEFVAIIGVNGSGKSTLAKHLNALLLPSSGKCFIKGMDTADPTCLWKIRQTAGMVFQNPDNLLDPKGRSEVLNTVLKLNKTEGITIVYITHFMEEAVEADRVVVMAGGRILEQGTPRAIFSDADKMKNLGLDVPVAAQVSSHLRVSGLELPDEIIKDEELVAVLCP
jgi:energy-coupling factor transporter ATP-binding protein EcfA2